MYGVPVFRFHSVRNCECILHFPCSSSCIRIRRTQVDKRLHSILKKPLSLGNFLLGVCPDTTTTQLTCLHANKRRNYKPCQWRGKIKVKDDGGNRT